MFISSVLHGKSSLELVHGCVSVDAGHKGHLLRRLAGGSEESVDLEPPVCLEFISCFFLPSHGPQQEVVTFQDKVFSRFQDILRSQNVENHYVLCTPSRS